jgi:hypothetical protein
MAAYELSRDEQKDQTDLFALGGERRRKLEVAMDTLSERFGAGVVRHAADLQERGHSSHNLDFLDDVDDFDDEEK